MYVYMASAAACTAAGTPPGRRRRRVLPSTAAVVVLLVALLLLLFGGHGAAAARGEVPRCHVDYNRFSGKAISKGVWAGLTYDIQFSLGLCTSDPVEGVMSVRLNTRHQNVTGRSGTVSMANLGVVHFALSAATLGPQHFSSQLCYSADNCTALCTAALMGVVDTCKVERTVMPAMILLFWLVPAVICAGFLTTLYVRKRMEEREQALLRLPEGYSRSPRVSPTRRPLRGALSPTRSPSVHSAADEAASVPREGARDTTTSRNRMLAPVSACHDAALVVISVPHADPPPPSHTLSAIAERPQADAHVATSNSKNNAADEERAPREDDFSSEMNEVNSLQLAHTRGPSNVSMREEDIYVDADEHERFLADAPAAEIDRETQAAEERARRI
ncbi:putative viscerotropic leishmaniasis antigen, partial [Leptomonas pyrrhocoris]